MKTEKTSYFRGRLYLGAAFAFVLLGTVIVRGGVFDDALLWMRGPVDANGDGWIKTTHDDATTVDLPDALKTGASLATTHTWEGLGPYTNIHVIANGEVGVPYANINLNSSYLHFDQPSWIDGDGVTNVLGGCIRTRALPAMTNSDPHTVFMRFRVDSFIDDGMPATLCALGYSSGTGGKHSGWLLQVVSDGNGAFWFKVVQGRPKDAAGQTGVGTRELKGTYGSSGTGLSALRTNQWIDVVFTCASDGIAVYSCGAGGLFVAETDTIGFTADQGKWPNIYCFGNDGTAYNDASATVAAYRQFRGDIAQIAFWNRRFTESEVREVMAWPRNDRWRLGVKDGTSDQFAGTAGATVAASAMEAFAYMPPQLATGESVSFSFDMDATNTLGRTQALRVRTTSASAVRAFFAVSVNGGRVRHFSVPAGGEAVAVLPAKLFVKGANNLTLTCLSVKDGTTAVFDSLVLGGAWTVGVVDNAHAEFSSPSVSGMRVKQAQLHAEDADWKRTVINLDATGQWATNTIHALADATVSDVRDGRFVLRGKYVNATAPMRVELLVNGVSAGSHTFPLGGDYEDAVFQIPAGTLNDGDNAFTLINRTVDDGAESPTGYISMDCRYFEFLPDPVGMVLSFY